MDGIDPDTLLEWLQTGFGDERDLQMMALEQLCMLLLMSDNIDRCFESCPPRTFLPALCKIFIDESATDNVLEVTARAITYYLDVSNECTRRITQVEGAVKAICTRLAAADLSDRASKDLAEQCVKLLEHVCQRETLAVYDAGGLHSMLALVSSHCGSIHKDTLHSAMSVITRLCGKMEPADAALPQCTASLGALLNHDDPKVLECVLRCFAALTDRCMRKQVDPVALTTHSDLVGQLLSKLKAASPSTNFTSVVLSLLSNLCRGSIVITEQVLSSDQLIPGLSAVLSLKEERSVVDGLRLADLLIILLCEGRSSLPSTCVASGPDTTSSASAEKTHRHLIDVIRQKDTGALVEAVESGMVDVNYTDDVGQTLLNWAAAFGALEMVVFLCEKGADVNRGNKSSSLHYAASFGRPDVTKVLLQRGANPDLRDEDGKTPLDKARERTEEDYLAVAALLENPNIFVNTIPKKEDCSPSSVARKVSTTHSINRPRTLHILRNFIPLFCDAYQKAQSAISKRIALSSLRKTVQHFTRIDLPTVEEAKEATEDEEEMPTTSSPIPEDLEDRRFADSVMGVVVAVADQEGDFESMEQAYLVIQALLAKDDERWVNELIRLGVFEKIEGVAAPLDCVTPLMAELSSLPPPPPPSALSTVESEGRSERSISTTPSIALSDGGTDGTGTPAPDEKERDTMLKITAHVEDIPAETPPPTIEGGETTEEQGWPREDLLTATAYRWREWRIIRSNESLFLWADPLVLEFSFISSSTSPVVRFFSDGSLKSFASTGKAGECPQAEHAAFLSRFRAATASVKDGIKQAKFICMIVGKKFAVPGWEFSCQRGTGDFVARSIQHKGVCLALNDELAGFVYEYAENGKSQVSANSVLDPEFHTGWTTYATCARSSRLRTSMQERRVQELALDIWRKHLKEAKAKPREALVLLTAASNVITEAVKGAAKDVSAVQGLPRIETVQELVSALECVRQAAIDERKLSTFEVASSGLVPALMALLRLVSSHPEAYPAMIFKETFRNTDALAALALRMVRVLEATEKFPLYVYDPPGGPGYGLQLLSKRIRMQLQMAEAEGMEGKDGPTLLNRTGRILKSEPLTTVAQLKHFLLKMVAKQWFDRDRPSFAFVSAAREAKKCGTPLRFTYTNDFDDQGVIYWLGTNARTESEWTNPGVVGVAVVTASDSKLPFGRPDDILSRDTQPMNCHTTDDKHSHFTIDLGLHLRPTHYTLRHARGYGRSALRNWLFQGSADNVVWEAVSCHKGDQSLTEAGTTASWPIEGGETKGEGVPLVKGERRGMAGPYRYFRIAQNGENSSGQTHYLSLSGFEIYGLVVDAVETEIRPPEDKDKPRRISTSSLPPPHSYQGYASRIPTLPISEMRKMRKAPKASPGDPSLRRGPDAAPSMTPAEFLDSLPSKTGNNRLQLMSMDQALAIAQLNLPAPGTSKSALANRVRMMPRRLRQLTEMVGAKVKRGGDWRWHDQDVGHGGKNEGTIVAPPEAGWVDVLWENGHVNSYRYGADGKYDVMRVDGKDRRKHAGGAASAVTRPDSASFLGGIGSTLGLRAGKRGSAAAAVPINSPASSGSATPSKGGLTPTPGPSGTSPASPASPSSSSTTLGASPPAPVPPPGTTIGKKSMSTTNLVEERTPTHTVAATGQAASAESLQHQTPSLENLLANYSRGGAHGRMETLFDEGAEAGAEMAESEDVPFTNRFSVWQEDEDGDEGRDESASEASESNKNLSVSAPNLAAGGVAASGTRSTIDTLQMLQQALEEEEMEADNDDDEAEEREEDKSVSESFRFFSELDDSASGSDRSLFDKIRDAIGLDGREAESLLADFSSPSSTAAAPKEGSPKPPAASVSTPPVTAPTGGAKKAVAGIRNKVSSYADAFKHAMQHMMAEPSLALFDPDDIEDEDMFDDDANEDDMDDEIAANLPVENLLSLFGAKPRDGSTVGDLRANVRQLAQMMFNGRGTDRVNRDPMGRDRGINALSLRQWDEEFVLKCTFNALIPAFDPRPGRTNAKQTSDVELPGAVPDIVSQRKSSPIVGTGAPPADTHLRIFLTGPHISGVENVTVEMVQDEASIFKYVQMIANQMTWTQSDRARRIWDSTYTLSYEDADVSPSKIPSTPIPKVEAVPAAVGQVLSVLTLLNKVGRLLPDCDLCPSVFISEKITQKLRQELSDPLVVASMTIPEWCERLIFEHPSLFTLETRQMYMEATSFGISRSIVWLQSRRDAALERSRGAPTSSSNAALTNARRDDQYEYRLGRIKHERVKIDRSESRLLEQAVRLLRFHAERKAILEIEYAGEEGTGLGPTLEFYALVAAEFQRKALALWMCDDVDENQLKTDEGSSTQEIDLGEGKKPPGFYVRRASGLFPAPLPPNSDDAKRAAELFRVLGVFLAKVLQDGRLVDLPLARAFLKLITNPTVSHVRMPKLDRVLDLDDLEEVHPVKGRFLKELSELVARKRRIEKDSSLDREAKRRRLTELSLCINGTKCSVEALGLNFTVNPPSSVFAYEEMELVEGGADIDVTLDNVDLYVDKCRDYYLNSGIRTQVMAFRAGFDRVFPLSSLRAFSPEEVQRLISGEQCPEWTREDVINFTEPKLGYSRESPAFLRFVDVLVGMNGSERKRFLQFATGCSNLPPGGLANLHPRLTIVRKVESGDGSYPSVNTCVHYLKMPEYSSAEILRERLLTACNEKGFHLN